MRIMVLGGAGFLGSQIVRRLVEQAGEEDQICVLDDLSTGARDNLEGVLRPVDEFHEGCATALLDLGMFDVVYHFASPASPDVFVSGWDEVVRANVGGAMAAADCLRPGGMLVLASSSEAYGQPDGPMQEGSLGAVRTQSVRGVYDESKRLAEAIAFSACARDGIRATILRIFNTYGPGMPDDGRVINTFVRQAQSGPCPVLTVHGDGSQTRSFCYVDDAVQQIMDIVLYRQGDSEPCQVFNVGNPEEHTIGHVASVVAAEHMRRGGSIGVVHVESTRPDDPSWRCPVMYKTFAAIGDRPLVTLEEGVRKCFS